MFLLSNSTYASVAQLVEHNLAKVGVARSSRVTRTRNFLKIHLFYLLNQY